MGRKREAASACVGTIPAHEHDHEGVGDHRRNTEESPRTRSKENDRDDGEPPVGPRSTLTSQQVPDLGERKRR